MLSSYIPNVYEKKVTHVLDTMGGLLQLEDTGKIAQVKNTIKKDLDLTSYIYNHDLVLNMIKKNT